MRLFLAIELPDAVRGPIADCLARNATRFPGPAWVPPEDVHMTAAFFGEVAERDLAALTDALRIAMGGIAPFRLSFDTIAAAPPRLGRPPHILWAAYSPDPAFAALAGAALRAASPFQADPPPVLAPRPHVTFARCGEGIMCPNAASIEQPRDLPAELDARQCTLFVSSRKGPGPHYAPLDRFPLHKVG